MHLFAAASALGLRLVNVRRALHGCGKHFILQACSYLRFELMLTVKRAPYKHVKQFIVRNSLSAAVVGWGDGGRRAVLAWEGLQCWRELNANVGAP